MPKIKKHLLINNTPPTTHHDNLSTEFSNILFMSKQCDQLEVQMKSFPKKSDKSR